jgi:hypothetical protein
MADILSEGTKRKQRQVIHSTTARSFDEGQGRVSQTANQGNNRGRKEQTH